ncbi:diguanylate cyclase (GGDEF)-like protein/PAS domain S-box-containing protein [Metabacillus crassostreae]|uniref:EAL domain-containing protein n=1 Tax=Metabacillus crassostreae TaxID=929098 RepID=UPI0019562DB0|nr:diguanylate cyclase (GGDEF)-like protein/PAS domain S-box-containing protein [Metabacillus crassostreae]
MNNYFLNLIKKDLENDERYTEIEPFIFDIILKHVQDLIFIMKVESDNSFTYLFANDIGKIHAKLGQDYVGKTFYDFVRSEIADHLHEKYLKAVESKKTFSYQDKVQINEKLFSYGETILTPIKNDQGKVIYIIAVTRDITDRVIEQRMLLESQEMYKSLVDHNMDAVFSINLSSEILTVNPSVLRLLNSNQNAIEGNSIFDLFEAQDVKPLRNAFHQTIDGNSVEGEAILLYKNKKLNVHYKTVPIIINGKVNGIFFILRDITEKTKQSEMIEHMAYHDPLTGLLNRSALKSDLKHILQFNNKQSVAVMYIDLDRFKMLNDILGHNSGDLLLIEVSKRLSDLVGPLYSVYRHGGDEFIIVLPDTDRKKAKLVADQLIQKFKEPFYLDEILYFISLSIGISMFPEDCNDDDSLITKADKALFVVKQRNRAQYLFYDNEMDKNTNELLEIETGLRRAIEHEELTLFYQPQIDLSSNKVVSFEALLRWNHPKLGNVSPGVFIPIAEESGLIIPIGEWVIEEACKQILSWQEEGYPETTIAINLSAKQFQQPHLIDMIESLFKTYKISPKHIEFEITEGSLQDAEEALKMITRLKKLGVMISVDDFGTGFSSLMYLKQFPIDTLKIDQSFIKDVLLDKKDEAIVTTILHLAEHLGLTVVAEGIETDEQLDFLSNLKCHKGQGYLFSRPIPAEQITKFFE